MQYIFKQLKNHVRSPKNLIFLIISLFVLAYIIAKAYALGNDINVYLHAARQFLQKENIYIGNPYNKYLYSPLFTLLISPLTVFQFEIGRVIWALINIVLTVRLWKLIKPIFSKIGLPEKLMNWWSFGVIILSIGFLNHNLNLGQVTILLLWLTFEGTYQIILKNKNWYGASLLALGINIKIVPLIALYYLFFKKKIKATIIAGFLLIASLFLPALFTGWVYNTEMLKTWYKTINPVDEKYVFENSNGVNSLNGALPGYFLNFGDEHDNNMYGFKRKITYIEYDTLVLIMQTMRILLVLSVLYLIFYRHKKRKQKAFYFLWEFSYLMLVSYLIFPHQMKYIMLYFVPAGAYMLSYSLLVLRKLKKVSILNQTIAFTSLLILFLLTIMGRDIIGNIATDLFDYYHFCTIATLVFIGFLLFIKPDNIIRMIKS